ncbi:MAG: response regulator [Planctomycetales bacterium]|nr:response regulator [Planctomycetales bacterium]
MTTTNITAEPIHDAAPIAATQARRGRVLLCDDDIFILRAGELKLRHAGFEVCFAHDGLQAWEMLGGDNEPFNVLVTDRQMPRMDGVELIQKIRGADQAWLRELPIILLTSRAHDLGECAVSMTMDKPFSPRNLVRQVEQLCHLDELAAGQPADTSAAQQ